MVAFKKVFKLLRRTVLMAMLAGILLLGSLPVTSAPAFAKDLSTAQEETAIKASQGFDELETGRKAAEVMPKELGSGSRQKNPIEMLKRAGEELGNDQVQRAFGAEDYDRSGLEKELARNKAKRGDD